MGSARAKGYITDFQPRPQTIAVLDMVRLVLDEYSDYLPLTARQIFYRMVGQYGYEKTDQSYARLCEAIVKARRAGWIGWHAIRDDGTVAHVTGGWSGPDESWQGELNAAQGYQRDRSEGQPCRIELWCEAGGMAPQLAQVARRYGVDVYSTGGFGSVTVTKAIADRVCRADRPTAFLHVGDFDPSGESIFNAIAEDVGAFVGADMGVAVRGDGKVPGWFEPMRVALTRQQVEEYELPTAPPKRSDSRSATWAGATCQAEAMDPATLGRIVDEAIRARMVMSVYDAVLERERRERDALVAEVQRNLDAR